MSSLQQIILDLQALYEGSPWFGDSFTDVVQDITPAEALAAPPNGHSICVLVWHMVKWRKSLTERLLGNTAFRANVTDADNWPAALEQTPASWKAAKAAFAEQQEILVRELSKRSEEFLETPFFEDRPYRRLVAGVVQHDIYHLGQVAMVKGLVRKHNTWLT